jgi:hypothetical protein
MPAPLCQKQGRRIQHFRQTTIGHLKHTDLVGSPEPVFHPAQDAKLMPAIALEMQYRIDHVFQHTRAGQGALLRHMPHQNQ